jgi:hypothetical protein
MSDRFVIPRLAAELGSRKHPTMIGWNRLEGRPRTDDMKGALRAEVHDALFMLTRQWQMGEYKGDDAGSPIAATALVSSAPVTRFQAGAAPALDLYAAMPVEARIEARPIPFERAGQPVSLDIRLQMGRYWLKLIAGIGDFAVTYVALYPIEAPDPGDPRHAPATAHPGVVQSFAAAAGRRMDGWRFLLHLETPGTAASDGVNAGAAEAARLDDMAKPFRAWFARQYVAPPAPAEDAWQPERLEYGFAVAGAARGGEKVLAAAEFAGGRLDWFSCDIDKAAPRLGAPAAVAERAAALLPVPLAFPGMPNTRWWAFEDGMTNLGGIEVSTTDLGRMAYLEFALLYANDWYLVPLTLPAGSLAALRGIAVTNVFNERVWVRPAGEGIDDDWQRWTMFTNAIRGTGREIADTGLFVAPVTPKIQQGRPLDEVLLMRDEMANLVWGIERTVPLPDGRSRPGSEAARELRRWFERRVPPPPAAAAPVPGTPAAPLRYDAMSAVAEHWIPFVVARQEGSARQTLLQRGSMLRFIEGEQGRPRRITPRSAVLREGLDQAPPAPYVLAEEEVPRAGVQVTRAFRRARGRYGRTYVWLGMEKRTGRGEGQSGLTFDRLLPQDG